MVTALLVASSLQCLAFGAERGGKAARQDTVANVAERDTSRVVFAFRSNLLVPLLNAGFEIPVGRHLSFEADWYSPWASPKLLKNRYCFELQAASVGLRVWFPGVRKERLTGHSIGVTAAAGHYDFGKSRYDGSSSASKFIRMDGIQGEAVAAMLDWTYACRIGRTMHLEFTVAGGAVYHRDVEYVQYAEDAPLLRDPMMVERRGWYFGPTKAAVNLVLPIRSGR